MVALVPAPQWQWCISYASSRRRHHAHAAAGPRRCAQHAARRRACAQSALVLRLRPVGVRARQRQRTLCVLQHLAGERRARVALRGSGTAAEPRCPNPRRAFRTLVERPAPSQAIDERVRDLVRRIKDEDKPNLLTARGHLKNRGRTALPDLGVPSYYWCALCVFGCLKRSSLEYMINATQLPRMRTRMRGAHGPQRQPRCTCARRGANCIHSSMFSNCTKSGRCSTSFPSGPSWAVTFDRDTMPAMASVVGREQRAGFTLGNWTDNGRNGMGLECWCALGRKEGLVTQQAPPPPALRS